MNVIRVAKVVPKPGPAEYFSGTVTLEDLSAARSPVRLRTVRVTFAPRARTAWHTHPHGQWLHILAGVARVQTSGEALAELSAGDSVWFEPGERHWHGAGPDGTMIHLAVQQADEAGSTATWLEPVTDEDYQRFTL